MIVLPSKTRPGAGQRRISRSRTFPFTRRNDSVTAGVRVVVPALLFGAFAAAPATLAAQAAVSGVVVDSITGRPLAGATVQLVPQGTTGGTPRGVDADSAGVFRFVGVAAGRYLLGFVHERLDSLGIQPPVRAVDVVPGATAVRADLAVPSARTIAAAVCGARRDSTGVLVGRVLDANGDPVAAGDVAVRWGELRVDAGGVRRVTPSVRGAAGADGRYAVCGIPLGVAVLVQATATASGAATAASGAIEMHVEVATPLVHRDLLVAAAGERRTARLAGHVRRPDGTPLAGARVVVRGAGVADSVAVSDADGAYRLDQLPGGTYPVEAIAIGFTPARAAADLRADRPASLDLAVGTRVTALQSVNVYASRPRGARDFLERTRRASGFVRVVTADDIARRVPLTIADALVMTPGVHVSSSTATGRPQILGRGECAAEVYLDGTYIPNGATEIDELLSPTEVGAIEVYPDAGWAPPEYGRMHTRNVCAVVLIWTRGALR